MTFNYQQLANQGPSFTLYRHGTDRKVRRRGSFFTLVPRVFDGYDYHVHTFWSSGQQHVKHYTGRSQFNMTFFSRVFFGGFRRFTAAFASRSSRSRIYLAVSHGRPRRDALTGAQTNGSTRTLAFASNRGPISHSSTNQRSI